MKAKLNTFFIMCFLFFHPVFPQSNGHQIDSLLACLPKQAPDTLRVNILNELATAFRNINHDTAFYFANEALDLASRLNYEMGIADAKRKMGGLYADLVKYQQGFKSAQEALEIYERLFKMADPRDTNEIKKKIGSAYNVLAHNKINQGNYPEGLKYSFLALKIRTEVGDRQGMADTEFNIGNINVSQHNLSEAIKHYTNSLKIQREIGNEPYEAYLLNAIGFAYYDAGNYAEARKYYSQAMVIAEKSGDQLTIAEINMEFGELSEREGKLNEALQYDLNALAMFTKIGQTYQLPLLHNNIGLVYMKQKKYDDASRYLNKSLSLGISAGHMEYTKVAYESLSHLASKQGAYKKALEYYKQYIFFRDSLLNKENTKKLVEQQMQYDFDVKESAQKAEQEKKDALAQKELQRQKFVRNGFMGGFAVVLLFAGVFFSQRNKIKKGKKRSDELLLNILPSDVADELKAKGSADAKQFDEVSVMFTDFKNFTQIAESLSPAELVNEIHSNFKAFDEIISKYNIEKIKTIGDAYMCVGGLPAVSTTHAVDVVSAALEIADYIKLKNNESRKADPSDKRPTFEIRIGIHSGPVVAGIVGVKKFAYDIWGDTVNIAARMESSGEAGKVNISGSTYQLVKGHFTCTHRGKVEAKNKGFIEMYFVDSSEKNR